MILKNKKNYAKNNNLLNGRIMRLIVCECDSCKERIKAEKISGSKWVEVKGMHVYREGSFHLSFRTLSFCSVICLKNFMEKAYYNQFEEDEKWQKLDTPL